MHAEKYERYLDFESDEIGVGWDCNSLIGVV